MIQIPLIDELREIRRRLSAEVDGDLRRYAEMLRRVADQYPGLYVSDVPAETRSNAPARSLAAIDDRSPNGGSQ